MAGFMCKSAAVVGALLIIGLAVCVQQIAIPLVKNMGVVVSGYTAKIACSAVFVQERTAESVAHGELSGFPFHLVEFVVDAGTKAHKHTAKHCLFSLLLTPLRLQTIRRWLRPPPGALASKWQCTATTLAAPCCRATTAASAGSSLHQLGHQCPSQHPIQGWVVILTETRLRPFPWATPR